MVRGTRQEDPEIAEHEQGVTEQVRIHRAVGPDRPGEQTGKLAVEGFLVDPLRVRADAKGGLSQEGRILGLQSPHHVDEAGPLEAVESPHGSEVNEPESPVRTQEHVPRVGVCVEWLAREHLSHC